MCNQLTQIPELIAHLSNLIFLGLRWQPSEILPDWINRVKELGIDLSRNKLTSLPEAIANLSKITQLNLSDNLLTSVPEAITNLSNLTKLEMKGKLELALRRWSKKF